MNHIKYKRDCGSKMGAGPLIPNVENEDAT
jgi:hypothetical protein